MKTKLLKKLKARFIWTWVPVYIKPSSLDAVRSHWLVYDRKKIEENKVNDVLPYMCSKIGVHYIPKYYRNLPRRKRALIKKYSGK